MEKIDYENITLGDLEVGEEIEIEPHPEGGMPVYCTICDVEMEKTKINVKRGNIMLLDIEAYKCPQCGEGVLDIDTASQLEREFGLRDQENSTKYELKLLKEGANYLLPLPKEFVNK
ncbi:hypothetical protein B6V00_00755 [ANME-1 cluster archaeon ex4572_4]|nr:MAG: hypothetical protein B6V00_00755 [ANME-1 cluster archaeon ex4572_4]